MRILKSIILVLALIVTTGLRAQTITSVHGVVSDDMGPLMGATVCEIDGTGRIINSAITDLNGNFTMKVKNPKDKIRFSYVGLKTQTLSINQTSYKIRMVSATQIKEVVVSKKRQVRTNGLNIPERELSTAQQTFSMKEVEGMSFMSVDEALQGRIAGLDIIGNSGDLGSGSTMRLRGGGSLSTLTDANPLIVVDGNIREVNLDNFDMASANNERFAELLNVNPDDIADIRVLKDAAAAAIYGSQGGNGVIEIYIKRGVRGKPRLSYSLKLTGTYQPAGYELLSGDDYTMLLKEAYFNPSQDDLSSANVREINYDPTFSEYEQYNNNTDWRDAVTQWGLRQNHYVTVSGGGEKANFRISGGFDNETGSIIMQKLRRFSTRLALDYNVSERIRVSTNFALTYTQNNRNSDNLLETALKKMPNMSIYEQDPLTGEDTSAYYSMLQSGSSVFNNDQKGYVNPVASAHLAKNKQSTYDMSPELIIDYRLLGMDNDHWQLNWRGSVYMSIFNQYDNRHYPQELKTVSWNNGVNTASESSSKSVSFNTKQQVTLIPAFSNKDHALQMLGRFELTSGSSNGQSTDKTGLPTGVEAVQAGGNISGMSSSFNQWRSMYYTFSTHYAYKGRYVADFTVRIDGTTKFGPGHRWGYFPSVSLKWIVSDEPWMKKTEKWLSMFAIRPSWGRNGRQPGQNYLYTSKYGSTSRYLDMNATAPLNIRLTDLQWETAIKYNLGIDLAFFNHRLNLAIEAYHNTNTDMLMSNFRIPSNTGFKEVPYRNSGKSRDMGWEFNINTNELIKVGKFTMDMSANFGNNRNEILEMDEYLLNNANSTYGYSNAETLQRVQLHNPLGAIYGFRYKGVYQYNYSTFADMTEAERAQFLAEGKTAPVAFNEAGKVIADAQGNPVRMMFNYTNDATGRNYRFNGGDAIYEDVNYDGQINALDIVYLGSSLPKLTGGFGFTFRYGDWRLNTQFNYRFGNKIINLARLRSEAMVNNDNQSQAVNYRWRKEGDITTIPRAMYNNTSNYNTLVSDRFVEDGSYLRMGYVQLSFTLKKKYAKSLGVNNIRINGSANNLFVITKYSGVDPDISSGGYSPAIDHAQTPRSRSYTGSIEVQF